MTKANALELLPPNSGVVLDNDAIEIGELYRNARTSIVDSVKYLIEAGLRLTAKKKSMDHGEWLPWLAANEAELGFKERAARLLMKGAETNRQLATDLEVPEALQLSRTLWGHDKIRGTQGTGENEWFTPAEYIELARTVLGDIDLDPASSDEAQRIVQAAQYFTREDDGLEHEWHGRVWLNPPYAQPYIANFASKMVAELRAGRVDAAIMLTHNYTDTAWFHELVSEAAAICFTRGRVKFYSGDEIAAPTQGQAFFYFGGDAQLFAERFKSIGFVMVPA